MAPLPGALYHPPPGDISLAEPGGEISVHISPISGPIWLEKSRQKSELGSALTFVNFPRP